jgi:CRISPR-associated protein Cas4
MEITYIPISFINDFIFCPRSIYYHNLYKNFDDNLYQSKPQKAGKIAHRTIDEKSYSNKIEILMNYEVYSLKYGLFGKIDQYNINSKTLIERKNNISIVYDGYIFQLYAQYFGLLEMGYQVLELVLYDYSKNKKHVISLPEKNLDMFLKFERTINEIRNFSLLNGKFNNNINKCKTCIYNELCDKSLC